MLSIAVGRPEVPIYIIPLPIRLIDPPRFNRNTQRDLYTILIGCHYFLTSRSMSNDSESFATK